MIDTHCHLTFPDYAGRVDEVLERARGLGVTGAITICTTSGEATEIADFADAHEGVWCSTGIHPLYVSDDIRDWRALRATIARDVCVAWGELGLDMYRERDIGLLDLQKDVLAEQLALIESCVDDGIDKPIAVHCRRAVQELLPILRSSKLRPERFVFHCFTESPDDARAVLDYGANLSFTGVVTYKNAPEVRESARLVPIDRVFVETDAPFLSPEPVRGTRPCEPGFTAYTAKRLAELYGMDIEAFAEQMDANVRRFYGIETPARAAGTLA
ncbi:MAG: DNAase [Phycisphaerae bacterium]|nr:DNAase [Phycisphaerae bacterium]